MSNLQRYGMLSFLWLLPVSFFGYQFILRLWPSLLMPQIMQQFAIDATAFGFLSSMYYYGYAGMQIPLAIALDKLRPRFVIAGCAFLCGVATLIFTYTENWYLALLGRFLVGVGSAVGFLGVSKVTSILLPNNMYSRMIGFSFSIGLLGAVYGGRPVSYLIDNFGWKEVASILGGIAILIGALIFLFLRNPYNPTVDKSVLQLKDFKAVLRSKSLLWLAFANLLMVGALEGFADIWGVNYLMEAYKLGKNEAAGAVSFIFVGMLFGGPILAFLSERFGSYNIISCCGFGTAGMFLILLFTVGYQNIYTLSSLFFLVGIMCCYQVLVFAIGSTMVIGRMLGVTVAFLNCINMLGGSFFHTLVGFLMDYFWLGQMNGEVRVYSVESYTYSLLVIPFCAVWGAMIVYAVKPQKQLNLKIGAKD